MGRLINFEAVDRGNISANARLAVEELRSRGRSVATFAFPDRPPADAEPSLALPTAQFATGLLINRYLSGGLRLVDRRGSFFRRPELAVLDDETKEAIAADFEESIFQAIVSINRRERARDLADALAANDFVFINRLFSGYAYGVAHGVSRALLDSLEGELARADLTFLFDIDPELAKARRAERGEDRYELDLDLQRRVRRLYLELLRDEEEAAAAEGRSPRILRLDASLSPDELLRQMMAALEA